MERREQVFVSSTYVDLIKERREVIQSLLEADCIPAGMELFPASDHDSWTLIQQVIRDSDYYVLIVGGRYGSRNPADNVSFTEMEYDYARQVGKPIMAFLSENPEDTPVKFTDDDNARTALAGFRRKVEREHNVKYWDSAGELAGMVSRGLIQVRKTHPAVGWVRGDNILTPELQAELAELRSVAAQTELARHEWEEEDARVARAETLNLARGSDEYELVAQTSIESKTADRGTIGYFYWSAMLTWDEIFAMLGPRMREHANQKAMNIMLCELAISRGREEMDRLMAPWNGRDDVVKSVGVTYESSMDVFYQLESLALIR